MDTHHGALSEKEREFIAYDCSNPANLTTVVAAPRIECKRPVPETKEEMKTYRIVQKALHAQFPIKICKAKFSRMAWQCYWDAMISYHTFPLIREMQFNQYYPILATTCKQMWNNRRFNDPYRGGDRSYPLQVPGRNNLVVNPTGAIWYDEYWNGARCAGEEDWQVEGPTYWGGHNRKPDPTMSYKNAVITDYITLEMIDTFAEKGPKEKLTIPNHPDGNLIMDCRIGDEECDLHDFGVAYWDQPSDLHMCPFYSALPLPIEGMEIIDAQGRTYFYHEETMIRLEETGHH